MSQDKRTSKRPRAAFDDGQKPAAPLTRHGEFWLVDGNVVLVAKNVAFRVYRGLLVAQSTVFADMISSSSPHSDEMVDGCPAVHVSDSPEDLAHFLRVLLPMTPRRFYRDAAWTRPCSFNEAFAIIRLAHKYNVEDVQKQALFALREYTFNDDFDKWRGDRKETISVEGRCAIGAANLARLLDEPEMLLIALYKCLSLDSGLLDGWQRTDGSVEYLTQDDVKRCIRAARTLSDSCTALTYDMFRPEPSADCEQRSRCEEALLRTLAEFLKEYICDVSDGSRVIMSAEGLFGELDRFGLCDACWKEVRRRDVAGRKQIWDRFPETFEVEAERWGRSFADQC